jgi:hypothetical protein
MANTRIARLSAGASQWSGSASGLAVDSDTDLLELNVDGTKRPIAVSNVEIVDASKTATTAASGTTYIADSTTSVVITLPATVAGLRYTLVVGQLTTSGGHAFSPAAADKIIGNGFTPADDKDAICTAATDVVGDKITLVGDGSLGWYVESVVGTWARES